jgi:hypothetical protein
MVHRGTFRKGWGPTALPGRCVGCRQGGGPAEEVRGPRRGGVLKGLQVGVGEERRASGEALHITKPTKG